MAVHGAAAETQEAAGRRSSARPKPVQEGGIEWYAQTFETKRGELTTLGAIEPRLRDGRTKNKPRPRGRKRAARSTDLPTSPLNSTTACPRSGSRVAPCENSTAGTRSSLHPSPFDVQSSLHLQSLVSFQISASFEAYVWRPRRSRLRAAGGHGQPRRRPSPPKANALPHTIRISNNISSTTTSIPRSTTSPMTVDPRSRPTGERFDKFSRCPGGLFRRP